MQCDTMATGKDILDEIKDGDIDSVRRYVTQCDNESLNSRDGLGNTLLHNAIEIMLKNPNGRNLAEIVKLIIEKVDPRSQNNERKHAVGLILGSTVCESLQPVLDALLAQQGVIQMCCQDQALFYPAVVWEKWNIVRGLLEKNSVDDDSKLKALFHICDPQVVVPDDILSSLCHPNVINELDSERYTPLMRAAEYGHNHLVLKLTHNGADVSKFLVRDTGDSDSDDSDYYPCRGSDLRDENSALSFALHSDHMLTSEAYTALCHPSTVNSYRRYIHGYCT